MDFCSKILTAGLIGFCPCSGSVVDCKKEELKCAKHDVIHKVRCYLKCMQKYLESMLIYGFLFIILTG